MGVLIPQHSILIQRQTQMMEVAVLFQDVQTVDRPIMTLMHATMTDHVYLVSMVVQIQPPLTITQLQRAMTVHVLLY